MDLTTPTTSPAPQLTKLQNSDATYKIHDYHLGETEKRQHINRERTVDSTTTVHEVNRIVNGSRDLGFGHHFQLVHFINCSVEERELITWIEGCDSKVVDHYDLKFTTSVPHDSQYQSCIGQGMCQKLIWKQETCKIKQSPSKITKQIK